MRVFLRFTTLTLGLCTLLTVGMRDSVFSRHSDVFYQHLVYSADNRLYHVDLDSGATIRPWQQELAYEQMYWSPQGSRYLFTFADTGIGLMSVSSTGNTHQPMSLFGSEDANAAGVSLLFQSSYPDRGNLLIPTSPSTEIWSPDGEWVAFVDKDRELPNTQLIRIRHDGTDHKTLYAGMLTTANPSFNAWSPDSQWVIFTLDSDIYRISVDGESMEPLTALSGQEQYLGRSNDGQWFYFDATGPTSPGINYGFYRMRFDGRDSQLLSTQRMGFIGETPDGEWVYRYEILSSGGYGIYRLNVNTAIQEHVADDLSSNFFAAWTADGDWLVVTTLDRRGMMQLTKLSAHTNQRVLLGYAHERIDILAVAPNSEWLFYRGLGSNSGYANAYAAVNLITGQTIQYGGKLAVDSRLVAWSPDSQWIIVEESVVQNNELKWRLARMRVDGSDHEGMTPYVNRVRFLGWWQIPQTPIDAVQPMGLGLVLSISGLLMLVRAKRRYRMW